MQGKLGPSLTDNVCRGRRDGPADSRDVERIISRDYIGITAFIEVTYTLDRERERERRDPIDIRT